METQESAQTKWEATLQQPGRLCIRLFGGFELLQNHVPLPRTRTRTEKWLLALLVLRANQEVERTWLAGTFWPDTSPEQALNNLRRSLSNLRQVLGEEAYRLLSPTAAYHHRSIWRAHFVMSPPLMPPRRARMRPPCAGGSAVSRPSAARL